MQRNQHEPNYVVVSKVQYKYSVKTWEFAKEVNPDAKGSKVTEWTGMIEHAHRMTQQQAYRIAAGCDRLAVGYFYGDAKILVGKID